MKRTTRSTIRCVQLASNGTYFSDRWFGLVKTAEVEISEGVDYCRLLKTIYKVFYLAMFNKSTKECPLGSYLVMNTTIIVTDYIPTMAIIYKCNYSAVRTRSPDFSRPIFYTSVGLGMFLHDLLVKKQENRPSFQSTHFTRKCTRNLLRLKLLILNTTNFRLML